MRLWFVACGAAVMLIACGSANSASAALRRLVPDDFVGVASVQTSGPADTLAQGGAAADSAYDIGSIAKDFTLAAVLTLAGDGALSLDDPIGRHLAEVPREFAGLTVRHLLVHRGGLPEYVAPSDFDDLTRSQALDRIWAEAPRFPPGEREAYSNAGYTVLAATVEEVADEPFTDFVMRRIVREAGLRHTGFYTDDLWRDGQVIAGGNENRYGANIPNTWPLTWALIGAGGMISTADDLHTWMRAFYGGEVVDPAALRELLGSEPLGLMPAVVAGGNNFGFNSFAAHVPGKTARLVTIIVLTNTGSPRRAPAEEVGENLLQDLAKPPEHEG